MGQRLKRAGLCVLVMVTVVLVVLDVRHVNPPSSREGAATRASGSTASPAMHRSASATPNGSSDQSFLAVAEDGTLVRATRGDCQNSTMPLVAATGAGGAFRARTVPGLREVLRVLVSAARDIRLIGLDANCEVARFSSTDRGRRWKRSVPGGTTWHLSADSEAATVASPRGRLATPCVPTGLSTTEGDVVRLLCGNGRILGTTDVGRTWSPVGRLRGAVDIAYTSSGQAFALAHQLGCPAAVMESIDGGSLWTRLTCRPGSRPRAIAARGGLVAAEVGHVVSVSTDGGASWPAASAGGADNVG